MSHLAPRSHSFAARERKMRECLKSADEDRREEWGAKRNAIHHGVWLEVEWNIIMCKGRVRGEGGGAPCGLWPDRRTFLPCWSMKANMFGAIRADDYIFIDSCDRHNALLPHNAVRSHRVSSSFLGEKNPKIFTVTAQNDCKRRGNDMWGDYSYCRTAIMTCFLGLLGICVLLFMDQSLIIRVSRVLRFRQSWVLCFVFIYPDNKGGGGGRDHICNT